MVASLKNARVATAVRLGTLSATVDVCSAICGLVSNADKRCCRRDPPLALGPGKPHEKTKANFSRRADPENR